MARQRIANPEAYIDGETIVGSGDIGNPMRVSAGGGLAGLTGASTFLDEFSRPNQAGLGVAPTGQPWLLTGAGVAFAQILDGRFCGQTPPVAADCTVYAGVIVQPQPIKIGGRFSFVPGPGGAANAVIALISSNNPTITLAQMVHLVVSPTAAVVTWWDGAATNQPMASGGARTLAAPLLTDGTVYEVWMTINGDNVHVDLPDGTSWDWYDPMVSQLAGTLAIFELSYFNTSNAVPRWESAGSYSSGAGSSLAIPGTMQASAGVVRTPVGTLTERSVGFFNRVYTGQVLSGVDQSTAMIHLKDGTSLQQLFESTGTPARVGWITNAGAGYITRAGADVFGAGDVGFGVWTGNPAEALRLSVSVDGKVTVYNELRLGAIAGPLLRAGAGSPEGVVVAPVGSLYLRTDGGAGTTLYVKEAGAGNVGWVGK